ncbi:DegT/DnrJ/EryC1/StrS family aminotransferase [Thalassospiraceae bacterium LMO-JJ14]|nr:DegT/DnrJ/EryC1/StrS family aminotransferase [Thalassospiraceae bacterium LMO-JJ14]
MNNPAAKYNIPFGRPWIEDEDRDAVMRVLQGHILTHGPECKGFEDEWVAMMGGGYAASTSSCMASLHLAWLDLGVGPGDEVIVPAMTHAATVHAVALCGATPVFVDCEAGSGNMTAEAIEAAITEKTKGIGIVHYIGIPCDMPKIMAVADAAGLPVVEDCAIAVGSRIDGVHVGLFGHVGCFSFYPVKHITTCEGGMIVSKDEETVARIAKFRAFSVDRTHSERKVPGIYDVADIGMNYRMSEMQGALGRVQIRKIPEILKRRKANFEALKAGLEKLGSIRVIDDMDPRFTNTHYCLIAVLEGSLAARRDDTILALQSMGVGTSVYYPHPVSRLTAYNKRYGYTPGRYANAELISDTSIALPVGPHLKTDDMKDIAEALGIVING